MRKEFEKWMKEKGFVEGLNSIAWMAWQAAWDHPNKQSESEYDDGRSCTGFVKTPNT